MTSRINLAEELLKRLAVVALDCKNAIELLWDSRSVMARFKETGPVSREIAEQIGLVGPAARACGLLRDVRNDHPSGIFRLATHSRSPPREAGDVFARAYVQWLEMQRSIAFIEKAVGITAAPAAIEAKWDRPRPIR